MQHLYMQLTTTEKIIGNPFGNIMQGVLNVLHNRLVEWTQQLIYVCRNHQSDDNYINPSTSGHCHATLRIEWWLATRGWMMTWDPVRHTFGHKGGGIASPFPSINYNVKLDWFVSGPFFCWYPRNKFLMNYFRWSYSYSSYTSNCREMGI